MLPTIDSRKPASPYLNPPLLLTHPSHARRPRQIGFTGTNAFRYVCYSPDDTVIAVMGVTGVGKSTFISYFSPDAQIGEGLQSGMSPPAPPFVSSDVTAGVGPKARS